MVQDLISKGWSERQAGRLSEAKRLYVQAFGLSPQHPDALNLLGVVAQQGGDAKGAASLIEKAIQTQPVTPLFTPISRCSRSLTTI